MRRWISQLFIAGYLGSLVLGIGCHALKFHSSSHPVAYFFVWDMFCGWSAFEARYHLVGEGESGTYYWLTPNPWGQFQPYGDLTRNHYDYYGNGLVRQAMNTLQHTQHEPIHRIMVIEENWPKKYNLPDHLWARRFSEPKDPMSYFWLRNIYDGDGVPIKMRMDFLHQLYANSIMQNPRLEADSLRNKPMFAISPGELRSYGVSAWSEDGALVSEESLPNAN